MAESQKNKTLRYTSCTSIAEVIKVSSVQHLKRDETLTYGTRETLTYGIGEALTPFEAVGIFKSSCQDVLTIRSWLKR